VIQFIKQKLTYTIGPAGALIAYGIIGFIVYWVTFSLGEMSTYIPVKYLATSKIK
jgi:amino acid permease